MLFRLYINFLSCYNSKSFHSLFNFWKQCIVSDGKSPSDNSFHICINTTSLNSNKFYIFNFLLAKSFFNKFLSKFRSYVGHCKLQKCRMTWFPIHLLINLTFILVHIIFILVSVVSKQIQALALPYNGFHRF